MPNRNNSRSSNPHRFAAAAVAGAAVLLSSVAGCELVSNSCHAAVRYGVTAIVEGVSLDEVVVEWGRGDGDWELCEHYGEEFLCAPGKAGQMTVRAVATDGRTIEEEFRVSGDACSSLDSAEQTTMTF